MPKPDPSWFKDYRDLYPEEQIKELIEAVENDVDEVIGLYPRAVRAAQVK